MALMVTWTWLNITCTPDGHIHLSEGYPWPGGVQGGLAVAGGVMRMVSPPPVVSSAVTVPVGAGNSVTLRDLRVFMDEATRRHLALAPLGACRWFMLRSGRGGQRWNGPDLQTRLTA